MKKLAVALAALMLLSCTSYTAFAAEADIKQVPDNQGIPIFGRCQNSKNYYEITLGVTGMDTVELPDGITLSGKSDSGADKELRVVIIPVTQAEEPEAYAWMTESTAKLGKEPEAYYLAFYRGITPVQPEGSVTIAMTVKDGYEEAELYYMDGNAESSAVTYTAKQGSASFGMRETGYYLFVKTDASQEPTDPDDPDEPTEPVDPSKPTDPDDPDEPTEPVDPSEPTDPDDPDEPTDSIEPSNPTDPDAPQTGDGSNLLAWFILSILAGTGLTGAVLRGRKNL